MPSLETGTSRTKVFSGARRAVAFSYRLASADGGDRRAGARQRRRRRRELGPGRWCPPARSARSSGTARATPGRYSFRLTAQAQGGEVAQSAQAGDAGLRDAFDLYDHIFPIRGKHDYGGAGAPLRLRPQRPLPPGPRRLRPLRHAAGRRPRRQGAVLGLPRRRRQLPRHRRRRHRRSTTPTCTWPSPRPFREGDRVYTGQQIGSVGDTGNAHGCHLHFEMWSAPGWYDGGKAFDPLTSLQAWDGWS